MNYSKILNLTTLKYIIGGAIGALIDLGILYILVDIYGTNIYISKTMSFVISATMMYIYQRYVTFFHNISISPTRQRFQFMIMAVMGYSINISVLYICQDILHIYYIIGSIVAQATAFVWNFTISNSFIFKPVSHK